MSNSETCSLNFDRLFDCFFVARLRRRQFLQLQNLHASIADFAETQPRELWDRFADSAEPHAGRTTDAFFVASLGKVFITTRAGIFASSSTDRPRCIAFSFKITNALIPSDLTALAMVTSFAPGAEVEPRINRAPFVFGLRSLLSKMWSAFPRLGTISIRFTPNDFANCAVNQSSSLVIRPEATMAISGPANCFNWSAACPIAVGQSAGTNLPSERICGSSKRSSASRYL